MTLHFFTELSSLQGGERGGGGRGGGESTLKYTH